jgi:hypothetical protein
MTILAPEGLAGCAVASGTAAAPGARHLLGGLLRRGALASLYDFTGPGTQICLLTFAGGPVPGGPVPGGPVPGGAGPGGAARFAFGLDGPAELGDGGRSFPLTAGEAALINPNTGALPAFRGSRDAALVTAIYRRVPALCNETRQDETRLAGNPWKMRLETAFPRAAADTGLLRAEQELRDEGWELAGNTFTRDGQCMLPVYEPAMIDLFDHRVAKPRYWIAARGPVAVQRKGRPAERCGVADRLAELGWNWEWLCAWRTPVPERTVLDRTAVAVFLPRAATAGALPLMLPRVVPPFAAALIAAQSSLVFDYVARQKVDGPAMRAAHWKQLPVPTPDMLEPHLPFIVPRVLELVYTSPDMRPLARDLDDHGEEPFAWDPGRRVSLRAELDAFFFRAYGIDDRDDVEYITGLLPAGTGAASADGLEPGKSQGDDGRRRARELTLAAYDRMAEADGAGAEYETRIFPPPGHGARSARKPLSGLAGRQQGPGRKRGPLPATRLCPQLQFHAWNMAGCRRCPARRSAFPGAVGRRNLPPLRPSGSFTPPFALLPHPVQARSRPAGDSPRIIPANQAPGRGQRNMVDRYAASRLHTYPPSSKPRPGNPATARTPGAGMCPNVRLDKVSREVVRHPQ